MIARVRLVSIKRIVEIVVALESTVADPRGPKAVCEPMPPNAPARSAALPLCSRTTITRNTHTIICTNVRTMIIFFTFLGWPILLSIGEPPPDGQTAGG
jgi:hypothetical protein